MSTLPGHINISVLFQMLYQLMLIGHPEHIHQQNVILWQEASGSMRKLSDQKRTIFKCWRWLDHWIGIQVQFRKLETYLWEYRRTVDNLESILKCRQQASEHFGIQVTNLGAPSNAGNKFGNMMNCNRAAGAYTIFNGNAAGASANYYNYILLNDCKTYKCCWYSLWCNHIST